MAKGSRKTKLSLLQLALMGKGPAAAAERSMRKATSSAKRFWE